MMQTSTRRTGIVHTERWRAIPGHPNYMISDMGRVLSMAMKKALIMSLGANRDGYLRLALTSATGRRHVCVHTLVLETFCGPRPHGYVSRHLNGVRDDNRSSNLAWGTHVENTRDMFAHGTMHTARLNEDQVSAILSEPRCVTNTEIAKRYGVNGRTISSIRTGKHWKHVEGDRNPRRCRGSGTERDG